MTELSTMTVDAFTSALASDSPAPGGGSASAAAGAMGAALLAMVARLTIGKEKYKDAWEELTQARETLDTVRARLMELVDEDTRAYDAVVAARRLPKATDAEIAARRKAMDASTILATTTPMQTAFFAEKALRLARAVLEKGNPNAASDAWVAALLLSSAVEGALANVRINLPGVTDAELLRGFKEDAEDIGKRSAEALASIREIAAARGL